MSLLCAEGTESIICKRGKNVSFFIGFRYSHVGLAEAAQAYLSSQPEADARRINVEQENECNCINREIYNLFPSDVASSDTREVERHE